MHNLCKACNIYQDAITTLSMFNTGLVRRNGFMNSQLFLKEMSWNTISLNLHKGGVVWLLPVL
ncbi:MAG: hypothetical protein R6U58_06855 [Bacteroidales bacterium]